MKALLCLLLGVPAVAMLPGCLFVPRTEFNAAQAENRALIARAERLYAESLGAQREHIKRLLSEFEIALADQQLRDAAALRERFAADLDGFERNWPTL